MVTSPKSGVGLGSLLAQDFARFYDGCRRIKIIQMRQMLRTALNSAPNARKLESEHNMHEIETLLCFYCILPAEFSISKGNEEKIVQNARLRRRSSLSRVRPFAMAELIFINAMGTAIHPSRKRKKGK